MDLKKTTTDNSMAFIRQTSISSTPLAASNQPLEPLETSIQNTKPLGEQMCQQCKKKITVHDWENQKFFCQLSCLHADQTYVYHRSCLASKLFDDTFSESQRRGCILPQVIIPCNCQCKPKMVIMVVLLSQKPTIQTAQAAKKVVDLLKESQSIPNYQVSIPEQKLVMQGQDMLNKLMLQNITKQHIHALHDLFSHYAICMHNATPLTSYLIDLLKTIQTHQQTLDVYDIHTILNYIASGIYYNVQNQTVLNQPCIRPYQHKYTTYPQLDVNHFNLLMNPIDSSEIDHSHKIKHRYRTQMIQKFKSLTQSLHHHQTNGLQTFHTAVTIAQKRGYQIKP